MQRSERLRMIIRIVDAGARSVGDLVELTGSSAITIRRDLMELAEQGALRRVRGGAAPAVARGSEYPFDLRQAESTETKRALAQLAAAQITAGDCVVIDSGTTALAVAHELAGTGITAMALSLRAAAALNRTPGNEVIVPGGTIGYDDLSFTGASVADAVTAMRFDTAIIGACAADPENGLTVAQWNDAHMKRAILKASRRIILVATADKFTRTAAHRFGELSDVDMIITTADAPPAVLYEARTQGIEVLLV
ncbi:DeoR/GlpR family DNA-binding transcription regulator [Glutamicibacter sp. NPDC087344]|uniref:DeoR/GlpR family DNA-binding transcription regulator n=1 Tax=Glutamicibacter sp. NPDC087344 TaxID=3363994 RepID=UPI00381F13C9